MTEQPRAEEARDSALDYAQKTFDWYKRHAAFAGYAHRASEFAVIVMSAAITATVAIAPSATAPIAVLGALVAIFTGFQGVYHWREDFVSYSLAREAVRVEQVLYRTGSEKFADPETRNAAIILTVSQIERDDKWNWASITSTGHNIAAP